MGVTQKSPSLKSPGATEGLPRSAAERADGLADLASHHQPVRGRRNRCLAGRRLGVDALLEHQTRDHDDLDIVVEFEHASRVIELLDSLGYSLVAGTPPMRFVLVDVHGRQVDVHPVTFDAEGGGIYQMDDGMEWVYPGRRVYRSGERRREAGALPEPRGSGAGSRGLRADSEGLSRALSPGVRGSELSHPRALLENVLAAAQEEHA